MVQGTPFEDVSGFLFFFDRDCRYSQDEFKIGTDEELKNDLEWAASRAHVLLRGDHRSASRELPKAHVPRNRVRTF